MTQLFRILTPLVFLAMPALAQEDPVRVDLLTPTTDTSRPFTVALHFSLDPEWHLYWKNPGDAGLPLSVTWQLPQGYTAGDLQFPVPVKLVQDGILAYAYPDELTVLCTITPPARGGVADAKVTASLDWLVCKESCIPGSATVNVTPSVQTPHQRERARTIVEAALASLPASGPGKGLTLGAASVTRDGLKRTIVLSLTGNRSESITDFYPEVIDGFIIDHQRIRVTHGRIVIPVTASGGTTHLTAVRGIVRAGDSDFSLTVPLKD